MKLTIYISSFFLVHSTLPFQVPWGGGGGGGGEAQTFKPSPPPDMEVPTISVPEPSGAGFFVWSPTFQIVTFCCC